MNMYPFDEVARLPLPGDNVAVAIRELPAGTKIQYQNETLTLDYTVLEGHRFAIKPIEAGDYLLSWELPFGIAVKAIKPGQYVVNGDVLNELNVRRAMKLVLPTEPNFKEIDHKYILDENNFKPAPPAERYQEERTFMGYRRSPARGVGTRNKVVLLGTTSRTGSFVKRLAARLQDEADRYPNIDGIVHVAHTEGAVHEPNNRSYLLRTLAGFIVNPNVGAVLIVDQGDEPINNQILEQFMRKHQYPLDDVLHRFYTVQGPFEENLEKAEHIVRNWLPAVNQCQRTPESISHLKIALQCGGSDAFSGISANPLLGWLAHELIKYGGSAVLAETDELIGAEPYILQKVRDLETARKFLSLIDKYKEWASWHGANAEGNPSGGNKYRGLYNIALKSIGAARKKDPETRLDYAIDYAERMQDNGFYFMDSPGNDLESIAGQVASGCNLIFFTTGNGSITNFPFVPTVKVVTTTERYNLLSKDMDVNAGKYLDGMSMDELGKDTFELTLRVASGQLTVGEKAGHSQVQIWRDWQQTDSSQLEKLLNKKDPEGTPIPIDTETELAPPRFEAKRKNKVGLILPTSLCSGQVANMIATRLNHKKLGQPDSISRFVTLVHTEGCGVSNGENERLYARSMASYAVHPLVRHCLLLEHGCEKTHNEFMRQQIRQNGGDPDQLGYASIQLDGGIEKVTHKVEAWFEQQLQKEEPDQDENIRLDRLRVGIVNDGPIDARAAEQLAVLCKWIVSAGGTVVVPENSGLIRNEAFINTLQPSAVNPSLAYGDRIRKFGFHIMETPTQHWVETITGLAATGVELIIALIGERPMQTHPFVPVLQITTDPTVMNEFTTDLDHLLDGDHAGWAAQILEWSRQTMEGVHIPKMYKLGNIDFQFTRGLLGVSL